MEVYLRIDIDIIAMALLASILLVARNRLDMQDLLNKAYFKVSKIIIVQLFFEASTCVINKRPELWLIPISYVIHVGLFTTAPILSYYGYKLIKFLISRSVDTISKFNKWLGIPVIINGIATILSVKYHFIFYIDSNNVYHRGEFFIVFSIITYFYFVLGLLLILRDRKVVVDQEYILLLIFIIFPILGGLIQTLFYGPLLMWSSNAFSLVLMYALLQQRMIHLDDLTGVWSRKSFDYYIDCRLQQKDLDDIGIIYCDIDHFKSINDQFGHMEGDNAIRETVHIIRSAIKKNDIVVRMGGDEFLVIIENASTEIMEDTSNRIKNEFVEYNQNSGKEYILECSFGSGIFRLDHCNINQFLHSIDSLMYEEKRRKKEIEKEKDRKKNIDKSNENKDLEKPPS